MLYGGRDEPALPSALKEFAVQERESDKQTDVCKAVWSVYYSDTRQVVINCKVSAWDRWEKFPRRLLRNRKMNNRCLPETGLRCVEGQLELQRAEAWNYWTNGKSCYSECQEHTA